MAGLEAKLEEAKAQLDEALEELKKSELAEERSVGVGHNERGLPQSPVPAKPDNVVGITRGSA